MKLLKSVLFKLRHNYLQDTEIIAVHFKRRLSGVTSSIIQLVPEQQKQGAKIKILGYGMPKNLGVLPLYAILSLWKKPKNRKFYIWHARRNNEMLIGIILRDILRAKIKLVFTCGSSHSPSEFTHYLMKKMDRLIAVSDKISENLRYPHQIIMHGVDLERFYPLKYKINKNKIIQLKTKYAIGCFGRLRESKGTDIFIDAMIELLPLFPDWTAILAGNITKPHKLFMQENFAKIKQANLEHRILYIGEINNKDQANDISNYYCMLDLYVAPSRQEGVGLTPLEAQASAVPVVASDAGSYADFIIDKAKNADSATGSVIKNIDKDKLIEVLKEYFTEPEQLEKMSLNARKFVVQHYPIEKEAAKVNLLYQELFDTH